MSTKVLDQRTGNGWALYNADCVDIVGALPDDSVDFSVFSPPFVSLYTFSNSNRDMSNVRTAEEFAEHFEHLVPSLYRVLRPGRLMAIHCMMLTTTINHDGYIGMRDFRGDLVRIFQRGGFIFHSEVTIWKDPVAAMQRSKAYGLLHKTLRDDSAMCRQSCNDYLVVVRKPGENDKPIAHKHAPGCVGNKCAPGCDFPVERWQRYASGVWASVRDVDSDGFLTFRNPNESDRDTDSAGIFPGDTLQFMAAREAEDERHISPLQLGVIRRAMRLWTRPDDVVLSPFAGIGSEGYVALQEGRKFVGAELKRSYFNLACRNLAAAEPNAKGSQMKMFSEANP